MTRYKRIPKTLWQRIWFWFIKPETIIASLVHKNSRYRITIGMTDLSIVENSIEYYMTTDRNMNIYIYDKEWFEANYEPVYKEIIKHGIPDNCTACGVFTKELVCIATEKNKFNYFLPYLCKNCLNGAVEMVDPGGFSEISKLQLQMFHKSSPFIKDKTSGAELDKGKM
jgi:hypothetical protein